MNIYEKAVAEAFTELKKRAKRLDVSFAREDIDGAELLEALDDVDTAESRLRELLPIHFETNSELSRHTYFLRYYLERNLPQNCRDDAAQLVSLDIPQLEASFNDWCLNRLDDDLFRATSGLLEAGEFDSAIRKAFVVLKEALCQHFGQSSNIDGVDLTKVCGLMGF